MAPELWILAVALTPEEPEQLMAPPEADSLLLRVEFTIVAPGESLIDGAAGAPQQGGAA